MSNVEKVDARQKPLILEWYKTANSEEGTKSPIFE